MTRAIGIDLGTSCCRFGVLPTASERSPTRVRSRVEPSSTIVCEAPSVVGLAPEGGLVVGARARRLALLRPGQTVLSLPRLLGRRFDALDELPWARALARTLCLTRGPTGDVRVALREHDARAPSRSKESRGETPEHDARAEHVASDADERAPADEMSDAPERAVAGATSAVDALDGDATADEDDEHNDSHAAEEDADARPAPEGEGEGEGDASEETCPDVHAQDQDPAGEHVGGWAVPRLLSHVLAALRRELQTALDEPLAEEVEPLAAVVSAPACFDEGQRQALVDACALAGIEVTRLIHPTIAAALVYQEGLATQTLPTAPARAVERLGDAPGDDETLADDDADADADADDVDESDVADNDIAADDNADNNDNAPDAKRTDADDANADDANTDDANADDADTDDSEDDAEDGERVLIVHLGHGHAEAAVFEVSRAGVETLAVRGLSDVGGLCFNDRLVEWMTEAFRESSGIDAAREPVAQQRMLDAACKLKRRLSLAEGDAGAVPVNLPFLAADESGPRHLRSSLTQTRLEQMIEDLVARLLSTVERTLAESGVEPDTLDHVFTIGGCSRIPYVQEKLEYLLRREPEPELDREDVITRGAARLAATLRAPRGRRLELGERAVHPVIVDAGGDEPVVLVRRGERVPLERDLPPLTGTATRWRLYQDDVPASGVPDRLLASAGVRALPVDGRERVAPDRRPRLSISADNRVHLRLPGRHNATLELFDQVGLTVTERAELMAQARAAETTHRRERVARARAARVEGWITRADRLLSERPASRGDASEEEDAAARVLAPLVQAIRDARACLDAQDDDLIAQAEEALVAVLDALPGDIAEGIRGPEPTEAQAFAPPRDASSRVA